jgi:hypothetical protein
MVLGHHWKSDGDQGAATHEPKELESTMKPLEIIMNGQVPATIHYIVQKCESKAGLKPPYPIFFSGATFYVIIGMCMPLTDYRTDRSSDEKPFGKLGEILGVPGQIFTCFFQKVSKCFCCERLIHEITLKIQLVKYPRL